MVHLIISIERETEAGRVCILSDKKNVCFVTYILCAQPREREIERSLVGVRGSFVLK